MSTFGGVIVEFPDVRVDYFRKIPNRRPPLACFLSHIHSDHLAGLESLKAPFVYCSAATKEILVRLERYFHRFNFAQGILESRKQHYKHLKKLLRPIPLETPTTIELQPGNSIQVTLFDANHCTGAVMFLFENDNNAVLYTGDIRSEPWFVNNLTRNPFLIEYTSGLKTLDCVYLDTSNLDPVAFPTKAEGLTELLEKVTKYPEDTVFHFSAWTFGYEEVWMALSHALKSPIHVDPYKLRLYKSLGGNEAGGQQLTPALAYEGPVLTGYKCGNTPQRGCLTNDQTVRIHSCEKSMQCPAINKKTVWIRPIIRRTKTGAEVAELGIGGGGDLTQRPELELDSSAVLEQLLHLFENKNTSVVDDVKEFFALGAPAAGEAISLDNMGLDGDEDSLSLEDLIKAITRSLHQKRAAKVEPNGPTPRQDQMLPRQITFPYSRHSSYPELLDLVKVFKPKDVYPCTVDKDNWHEGVSMRNRFGSACSGGTYRHDQEMYALLSQKDTQLESQQTHTTEKTESSQNLPSSPLLSKSTPSPMTGILCNPQIAIVSNYSKEFKPSGLEGRVIAPSGSLEPLMTTPSPRRTYSVTPSSASQRRRREDVEDARQTARKRQRPQNDGSISLPQGQREQSQPEPVIGLLSSSSVYAIYPQLSKDLKERSPTPFNFNRSIDEAMGNAGLLPMELNDGARPTMHSDEGLLPAEEESDSEPKETFFDPFDDIWRCSKCGHEVWAGNMEFCTACDNDGSSAPYWEIQPLEVTGRPDFEFADSEIEDNNHAILDEIMLPYLDCHSSAYDSQDNNPKLVEEYETNSFIDDASEKELEDSSSDGETKPEINYKAKFLELQKAHRNLQATYLNLENTYEDLNEQYHEMRNDFLESEAGTDYKSDEMRGDMVVVDVVPPDPMMADVVLTPNFSSDEAAMRVVPDQIGSKSTSARSRHDWGNVSLVSPQNNHTTAEIEL